MASITRLRGIRKGETEKLRAAKVLTIEQFWQRISEEQDNGFAGLCGETGIDQSRLIDLLSREALRQTNIFGISWLGRHWLDLLLIAGVLILIVRICHLALSGRF